MSSSITICLAIILLLHAIKAEDKPTEKSHSTSVSGMVQLVLLEAKLVENLASYAEKLQAKFDILERIVPLLELESEKAMKQVDDYISNPLNGFSLIRRMHEDWPAWQTFMETQIDDSHATFIDQHRAELTTPTDLEEACQAIQRLQDFYNLKANDMAKGLLNGTQYDVSLNALDSYALGQHFYRHTNRLGASEWFAESAKWLMIHKLPTPIGGEHAKMLHLFANALSAYKQYSIALPIFDNALKLGNKTNDSEQLKKRLKIEQLMQEESVYKSQNKSHLLDAYVEYAAGCRGEFQVQTNLYCEYKFKPSPFLRLAPFKVEVLHLDPYVAIYHSVMSASEINELQHIARPNLKRSMTSRFGKYIPHSIRTVKGVFSGCEENNVTMRVGKRVEAMTDLSMEGFEKFNILNYGLGGHYAIHHDYFNLTYNAAVGNRIATVIFYLSDVEQGGATVFPTLKLMVRPQRGVALFWYNLHSNGSCDTRTLHAGCPVLVGSKWAMTQWIGERPQFARRPCPKINSI